MRRILVIGALLLGIGLPEPGGRALQANAANTMPTCATCRQPITSTYVEWDRKRFHPQHFVCAACQRPIGTQGYVPFKGQPYHQHCYLDYAERCGVCGKPLIGQFVKKDGQSYHEACFQNILADKCNVCGVGITGQYFIDSWGNKYHAQHQRQTPNCEYCGRIISPRTSAGGNTYPDGRHVCGICYKSQITGDWKAKPIIEAVRSRMRDWGIDVPAQLAPIILVDRTTLRRLLRRTGHPGGPNVNGFTSVLTEKQAGKIVKREMAVYILYGMPREMFEGTVAHELTHVWINLHNGRRLAPAFEEGSCNDMKFLIHQGSKSELAPHAIKLMFQDKDPSYGAGFRRVKSYVDHNGVDALLGLLARGTSLPPGY